MANAREQDAMRRAILIAANGLTTTSPNPPVGCVVLNDSGAVVGEGYHHRKGEPHAEAHALAMAGEQASGATAIVTLEPCNHVGRTPPCHQALNDAGIRRVVIGILDPTSRGEGGAVALQRAGLDVEVGALADEARIVLGPWLLAQERRRPNVTWSYRFDESRAPIPLNASLLAKERQRHDAVLELEANLISEGVPRSHGSGILRLDTATQPHDEPGAILNALYNGGVRTLLLHSGAVLVQPYLMAGLVDRVVIYGATPDQGGSATPGDVPWLGLPPNFVIDGIMRESLTTIRVDAHTIQPAAPQR